MNWENIKSKAINEALGNLNQTHFNVAIVSVGAIHSLLDGKLRRKYKKGTLSQTLKVELIEDVKKVISNWDIRSYKKLLLVFPNAFPKKLYGVMELGENGWEII